MSVETFVICDRCLAKAPQADTTGWGMIGGNVVDRGTPLHSVHLCPGCLFTVDELLSEGKPDDADGWAHSVLGLWDEAKAESARFDKEVLQGADETAPEG